MTDEGRCAVGAEMALMAAEANPGGRGRGGGGEGEPPGRPVRALVVDDDKDVHETLADVFGDLSYAVEVMHAMHGREALEVMERARPDVVFLDIRMPVMDGLSFRREMLADPDMRDIFLVVLTGTSWSADEGQALMADEYVTKPPLLAKIYDVMGEVVARMRDEGLRRERRLEVKVSRFRALERQARDFGDDAERELREFRASRQEKK